MNATALHDALKELLRLPREQAVVEFKENFCDPEKIGHYLSALANTAALQRKERAWMVWGVKDDSHQVVGTTFNPYKAKVGNKEKEANQALQMWLQVMTSPRADFAFHELEMEGKRVVMLEIYPARSVPMAFRNVRYIRVDSHTVDLAKYPSHEARLWSILGRAEDWTGCVIPDASVHDLDPEAIEAVY